MGIFDVFVAVIWGIVEGITEWLPVSSTEQDMAIPFYKERAGRIHY